MLVLHAQIRKYFTPIINIVSLLPIIIYLPLVYYWIKNPDLEIFYFVSLSAFVPVFINCFRGFINIQPFFFHIASSMGAKPLHMIFYFYLPGAASSIIRGLRISSAICLFAILMQYFFKGQGGTVSGTLPGYFGSSTDILVQTLALGLLVETLLQLLKSRLLIWEKRSL